MLLFGLRLVSSHTFVACCSNPLKSLFLRFDIVVTRKPSAEWMEQKSPVSKRVLFALRQIEIRTLFSLSVLLSSDLRCATHMCSIQHGKMPSPFDWEQGIRSGRDIFSGVSRRKSTGASIIIIAHEFIYSILHYAVPQQLQLHPGYSRTLRSPMCKRITWKHKYFVYIFNGDDDGAIWRGKSQRSGEMKYKKRETTKFIRLFCRQCFRFVDDDVSGLKFNRGSSRCYCNIHSSSLTNPHTQHTHTRFTVENMEYS